MMIVLLGEAQNRFAGMQFAEEWQILAKIGQL
jgi:hypothetical protein